MSADDSISNVYQSVPMVEQIAIHIVTIEQTMMERLEELMLKNRLFKQVIGNIDRKKVFHALRQTELTVIEKVIYDAILEVEFYIEEHEKTKNRQRFVDLTSADEDFTRSEQSVLSRMEELFND